MCPQLSGISREGQGGTLGATLGDAEMMYENN